MIRIKDYESAIKLASDRLQVQFENSTLHGSDLKDVAENVAKYSLEIYNLTLKFMGQEEGPDRYEQGVRDGLSRARSRPGDGDMGG